MAKKSTGSRYTEEFKAEAIQLAHSSPERSIRQLAYELGIADQTFRNWIKQAEIDRGEHAEPQILGVGFHLGRLTQGSTLTLTAVGQVMLRKPNY